MPFIRTIPPRQARGALREAYGTLRGVTGVAAPAAGIVQLFSLHPAAVRRMVRSWQLSMWTGGAPRALRETLAAAVSRLNSCHY